MNDTKQQNFLYKIKIFNSSETEICYWESEDALPNGSMVVCPTRYGNDLGKVLGPVIDYECEKKDEKNQYASITRIANDADVKLFEDNKKLGQNAFSVCLEKIKKHKLEMKLVSAHYLFDEPKILFFFTAESRVDFRNLVKDLVSVFKMRIELRQIGVRDESRVVGGMGVCGRKYCCHGVTDKLEPVSIKMAKEQNLSLNSMKISGPCGRLLCCLSYEYDFYREEKRKYPNEGSKIKVQDEIFRVSDVNILSKIMKMVGNDGRTVEVPLSNISRGPGKNSWQISLVET